MSEIRENFRYKSQKRQHIEKGGDVIVTTKEPHDCIDCRRPIEVGTKARYIETETDYKNQQFKGLYQHEPPCMTPKEIIERALEDAKSL